MKPTKENTIDLETAKKRIKRWRDKKFDHSKDHELKGFLIPKSDLQNILNEEGVENARAYLAVRLNDKKEEEVSLILVGVDSEDNDMIDASKDQYIYDFVLPCPPMCSKGGLSKF